MTTDPHAGIEIELMKQGRKKLAYLYNSPSAEDFIVEPYKSRYLVYKNDNIKRASCWKRTDAMFSRGIISLVTAHARRGILLDYDRDHIRSYIQGRGLWEGLR